MSKENSSSATGSTSKTTSTAPQKWWQAMYVSLRWLQAMERKAGASSQTSTPAISNDRKTWGYRGPTVWTSPKLPSIDFLSRWEKRGGGGTRSEGGGNHLKKSNG